jgi:excinuclease UvrABC ATPase subunit
MSQDESQKMAASIDGLKSDFVGLNSKFEKLQSGVESSYASIAEYFRRLEAHIEERFETVIDRLDKSEQNSEKRFEAVIDRLDKSEQNTRRMSEDLTQLRSLTSERFDVIAGQQRISDQGHYRAERKMTDLERRVEVLENERRPT